MMPRKSQNQQRTTGRTQEEPKARLCYDIITKNLIVAEVQKLTGDITKFKWIPTEDMVDTLIK